MIDERRQNIRKHLARPHDEKPHQNPLPYLLRQRRLHDLPEAKADDSDDGRDDYRGPNHDAFGEGADVQKNQSIKTLSLLE